MTENLEERTARLLGKTAPRTAGPQIAPGGRTETRATPLLPGRAAAPGAATAHRPRLVVAVDGTASRQPAWDAAQKLHGTLFTVLPGRLEVALAVHGGSCLHTFTAFTSKADDLRQQMARICCEGGYTQLVPILRRVLATDHCGTVLYIGDCFEESDAEAAAVADALKARGTRVIILQEGHDSYAAEVFHNIAARTGGAVLPFDSSAIDRLRDLLGAVAVLAVGGTALLVAKRDTMPAATLLLEHLSAPGRDDPSAKRRWWKG